MTKDLIALFIQTESPANKIWFNGLGVEALSEKAEAYKGFHYLKIRPIEMEYTQMRIAL